MTQPRLVFRAAFYDDINYDDMVALIGERLRGLDYTAVYEEVVVVEEATEEVVEEGPANKAPQ